MASAYLIHVDPPSGYADPKGMAEEYRPWLALRKDAGDGSLVIFEGSRSPDDFDQ